MPDDEDEDDYFEIDQYQPRAQGEVRKVISAIETPEGIRTEESDSKISIDMEFDDHKILSQLVDEQIKI